MKLFLITLSVVLFVPNLFRVSLEKTPLYDGKEKYNAALSYINSVEKLISVSDSIAAAKDIKQGSLQYAEIVSNVISERFYHGFSHFTLQKNWVAATSEYCFGHNLSCTVKANDILKYNYGGCSQQSIVLMEVMKAKHISYRSVGFPHHYALELNLEGKWYFFDPNMEPVISDSERSQTTRISSADSFKRYYDQNHYKDLDWKFGNGRIEIGKINPVVAPNAKIFQASAFLLSKTLWLFPLMIVFYRARSKQIIEDRD